MYITHLYNYIVHVCFSVLTLYSSEESETETLAMKNQDLIIHHTYKRGLCVCVCVCVCVLI